MMKLKIYVFIRSSYKPDSEHCISKILNYCNTNLIPVTVCGARTGLSGGSLPLKGACL